MKFRLLVSCILLVAASAVCAQAPAPAAPAAYNIQENYTKYEYRIPMRDGKKLVTAVYVPKDQSRPAPFLMVRTPYNISPYRPRRLGST